MAISFAINIPSREDDPIHTIRDILVVGSQEGDLVLDDPSVEGRHCSFIVNDDVISVIDHNSAMGTFIDSERIPSEKMIILLEGDTLKFGDIEAKLVAQELGEDDENANVLLYSMGAGNDEGKCCERCRNFVAGERLDLFAQQIDRHQHHHIYKVLGKGLPGFEFKGVAKAATVGHFACDGGEACQDGEENHHQQGKKCCQAHTPAYQDSDCQSNFKNADKPCEWLGQLLPELPEAFQGRHIVGKYLEVFFQLITKADIVIGFNKARKDEEHSYINADAPYQ